MIGNKRNALRAVEVWKAYRRNGYVMPSKIRAWQHVGSGCSRTTFLHISTNTVYKICDSEWSYQSEEEIEFFDLLRGAGYDNIPELRLFVVEDSAVTAMPYLPTRRARYSDDVRRTFERFINDPHGGNIGFDETGKAWLIDGGIPNEDLMISLRERQNT